MRPLFYSSLFAGLILLVSTGCTSVRPGNLIRFKGDTPPLALSSSPFTSASFDKVLYKATMKVKGNHLTGILLIKRMTDTVDHKPVHRFLFSNEFGMTYFDLELRPGKSTVIYCFEPMAKKALLSLLQTDFRLLITSPPPTASGKWFTGKDDQALVYKYSVNDLTIWDIYNSKTGILMQRNGKTNPINTTQIAFTVAPNSSLPQTIDLTNPVVGLTFSMRKLN